MVIAAITRYITYVLSVQIAIHKLIRIVVKTIRSREQKFSPNVTEAKVVTQLAVNQCKWMQVPPVTEDRQWR
jgi:hypothetical protein